jgi:diguanylate cyclase (GGDEF)-like protein/PAS domain S-box-containing protein
MGDARLKFYGRVLDAAGVGGWEYEVGTRTLTWTPVTSIIHDLEPGEQPTLEGAIAFYAPEARPVMAEAVDRAIRTGESWDLELPVITARGRAIWVRACGQAVREDGQTILLTGAFQDVTARRDMLAKIERLSVVAQEATNAVIITDPAGRTEWVNRSFERMTGYALADLVGRNTQNLLHGPLTEKAALRELAEKSARGESLETELLAYSRNGRTFWLSVNTAPIRDGAGTLTGFIAVASDISARRRAEDEARMQSQERQRAEALLRDILEALPNAVSAYDAQERLLLSNKAYADMFPIEARLARPGRQRADLIREAALQGQYPEAGDTACAREAWFAAYLRRDLADGGAGTLALPDGRFVQEQQRRSPSGNLVRVHTDTSDLKRAEEALRAQAYRDTLTKLPNRRSLLAALETLRPQADAIAATFCALTVFDVDFFKDINDSLGHDVGDDLLSEVARRLMLLMRPGDLPARLGGDEFAILFGGDGGETRIRSRMDEITAALCAPMTLRGRVLGITISAGVTLVGDDGRSPAALLKNADLALYEAKRSGRARWCWFRPEQSAALERRTRLSVALRGALQHSTVDVALQPKRLLAGGHVGFEALARWHDGCAWQAPAEFVDAAEDTGILVQLGRTVTELALARIRALRDLGYDTGRVAINVKGRQLLDGAFVDDTMDALRRHDLGPGDLEFEVTEAVLLGNAAGRVEQVLRALRALGIGLALDDFGTGYASLAHVSRLPFDRLKIDRSFVAEIGLGPRGGVIARSVIALARSLDMQSVAEGVETQAQMDFLAAEGCDAAQGYLIARPMLTVAAAAGYLDRQDGAGRRTLLTLVRGG